MFKFRSDTPLTLFALLTICIGGCLFNTTARAHTVGVSQGKYQLLNSSKQARVQTELYFARSELQSFINLDANADGALTGTEFSTGHKYLQKVIIDALHVNTDTGRCAGKLNDVTLVEADGIRLSAEFLCPKTVNQASIELHFLANLARGHRHLIAAKVSNETSSHDVAYLGKSTFQLISYINTPNKNEGLDSGNAVSFFVFGFEHILSGYDHLLFLFGLILIAVSFRQVFFSVTAFTLAHSITLGLSVLGVWAPNSAFVEPLIALSIVYVGIENCIVNNFNKRWILTFVFGLIHGFGFAGALQDIALSGAQLPWVLLNFNLGVETGQFVVILLAFPLLIWLRRKLWFNSPGIAILNIGLVLIGTYWFLDRTSLLFV